MDTWTWFWLSIVHGSTQFMSSWNADTHIQSFYCTSFARVIVCLVPILTQTRLKRQSFCSSLVHIAFAISYILRLVILERNVRGCLDGSRKDANRLVIRNYTQYNFASVPVTIALAKRIVTILVFFVKFGWIDFFYPMKEDEIRRTILNSVITIGRILLVPSSEYSNDSLKWSTFSIKGEGKYMIHLEEVWYSKETGKKEALSSRQTVR